MKVVMLDKQKCTGCRMCQLACSVTKYGEFNIHRSACLVEEGEIVPFAAEFCRQCKKQLCREACPFDAFEAAEVDGVYRVNREKCKKCKKCVAACPFHLMRVDGQDGFPLKCDLCGGDPWCVRMCPFEVIALK